MRCPFCLNEETKVVDSRDTEDFKATRRRRECLKCNKRFTTYERLENFTLMIVKKDDRREVFSRDKIRNSILRACEKRPINIKDIDRVVNEIEEELRSKGKGEIKSKIIGESVIEKLKELDKVAYIRFASVYREFKDADEFVTEVNKL